MTKVAISRPQQADPLRGAGTVADSVYTAGFSWCRLAA